MIALLGWFWPPGQSERASFHRHVLRTVQIHIQITNVVKYKSFVLAGRSYLQNWGRSLRGVLSVSHVLYTKIVLATFFYEKTLDFSQFYEAPFLLFQIFDLIFDLTFFSWEKQLRLFISWPLVPLKHAVWSNRGRSYKSLEAQLPDRAKLSLDGEKPYKGTYWEVTLKWLSLTLFFEEPNDIWPLATLLGS